ncbi:MAG TPA: hypothetical protein VJ249_00435 [Candidatus Bathyarchaeia archaeon]|nr:hypothetical protein [Candidatus Bathyarchaeia archaeon]
MTKSEMRLTRIHDGVGAKARKTVIEASDEPLLIAVENLKKGMMFTMSQLNSRRVLPKRSCGG